MKPGTIERLVNWNSDTVDDRLIQLAERIEELQGKYDSVAVIAITISTKTGKYVHYEPSYTEVEPSDLLMAAEVLRDEALKHMRKDKK